MKRVIKDTPLSEITLRKYEKPYGENERELVKKLCLSLGVLQPGDSRDVIVDVLLSLLKDQLTSRQVTDTVIKIREQHKLPLIGVAESNIRRQLKRLKDLYLIESVATQYRIKDNGLLKDIFVEHIEKYYLNTITQRVKEYLDAVDTLRR